MSLSVEKELAPDVGLLNQKSYDLWSYAGPSYAPLYAPEISILINHYNVFKNSVILDAGCGSGRATPFLELLASCYVGFDYSLTAIAKARQNCPSSDLRVMDARDLREFQAEAFDNIFFLHNSIDYVGHDDRIKILSEFNRILKPGGMLVFSSHSMEVLKKGSIRAPKLRLSFHPVRCALKMAAWARKRNNYRKIADRQQWKDEYALIVDGGFNYSLLTYYIDRTNQQKQLKQSGFDLMEMYNKAGEKINLTDSIGDCTWIHYLARKISDPAR